MNIPLRHYQAEAIELLGGTHNAFFTVLGAGLITPSSDSVLYCRWKKLF